MDTQMSTDVPKKLDLNTLRKVYDTLRNDSTKNNVVWTEDYIARLKNAAVETDVRNSESVLRISYALRCLTLAPVKLRDEFYQVFSDSLCDVVESLNTILITNSGYNKLQNYIKFSHHNKQKLLLVNSFMICLAESEVNFTILDNFYPNEWRKELLLYSLFNNYDADVETVQGIMDKINNNVDLKNDEVHSLEDMLEILVCNNRDNSMNFYFLDDLFFLLRRKPEIRDLLFNNFQEVQNEINKIKKTMLSAHYSFFNGFDSSELKYFLKYPFDVLHIMMTKESDDFKQLVCFKQLLEYNKMDLKTQIKVILKLNPKESFYKWKQIVAFEIVKNMITVTFPAYQRYLQHRTKISINQSLVSKSKICCTCFSSKCRFHHTTECCDLLYALNTSVARVIFNCCELSNEIIEFVESLISRLLEAEKIVQLTNALDIIEDYEMQFTNKEIQELFSKLSGENFYREVHKFAIQKSFPGSYEKNIDQLLDEIEELFPGVTIAVIELFDNVQSCYKHTSVLFPDEGPIKNWSKNQIRKWGILTRIKEKVNTVPDEELLAVIKRAAEETVKLKLRHIQLISVLLMIKSNQGKGRLCQINTGEGKTLIIATLAAYYILKGHSVDIYTSSPVLAIPQSKEYKDFYTVLNITVTNNINHNSDYSNDVIYGTNNSFQRDVLLDEFRKNGVRSGRSFDIAIVDEVDNMLIDGNNWILMLSCDMPAMDYLEVLLAAIYIQVNEAAKSLIEKDGRTYYLVQETAIDNCGNVKPEILVEEVPIEGSKRNFIIKSTEIHLRKLIRDTEICKDVEEGYPEIKIPNHLREVICKVHLKRWIANAVNAIFKYVKDEDYILKDGKVTIVDADNTGSVKSSSTWQAGLHQFLEIKHGARVQPESFTTNFMSNVGLFNRYVSKLFGLTGTLGSAETKSFLHTTYNVDSVVIPPFKLKQHKHLKPILVSNNDDKYVEITKSCIRKLKHGQAALVIMKYIRETVEVANVFIKQFHYDPSKIKIVKTDDDSEILDLPLSPGEIIITTNIAGRGTDVKLNKNVDENGGLHVCLTFSPLNSRVEHQNIGRTSRKGNRGTSQFILSDPQCLCDIEALKRARNIQESKTMSQASDTVKTIKTKDRIFRQFCQLLDEINGRSNDTKKTDKLAAEERFATWLVMNEDKIDGNGGDIDNSFDAFKKEILNDDRNNTLIKNPCMHISVGNKYLVKKKYDKAICEYNSAIILDHNFSEYAYYNRARAMLAKYGDNMREYDYFIDQAVRDLKKTRKLIEEKEYALHLLQTASKGDVFSEQISNKLNLYNLIKNTIELAIGPDVEALNEQIKKIEEDQNNKDLPADVKSKMTEMLKNLNEYKKETGTIMRAKQRNRNIEVSSLGEDFMPDSDLETHKNELYELKMNGWIEGFKITEIKPIDWTSVISLLGIGLGQLLIGAALTVFTLGAGASIGMGLISEGVSDIITAVKDGIINRDFDWATWALMKVISIAVSVVCAGFKAIKDAAKTAYAGAKSVVTSGAKALTQTTKEGWKIVAKKMGMDMAKGVAKEIVTDLVVYGIDKTVLPMIEEIIVEKVKSPIQEALLNNSNVAMMLKLDLENGNHNYENKIKSIAQKILTPEEYSKLRTIATAIATRVADNKGLALTRQVCTGLVGAYELTTFTSRFITKLTEDINGIKVDRDVDKNKSQQAHKAESDETVNEVQYGNSYDDDENDIDLSKAGQSEEQIKLDRKPRNTNSLSNDIAGMVSKNMIQILKGNIVMPVVQMGVNYSIDKISSRVNGSLEKEMENYRSKKNIIHDQNKAYTSNEKDSKNKYTAEEIQKVDKIVDELKNGGPAGLVHLGAISAATDRPIEVYDEKGRLKYTIGDSKKSKPIQAQYNAPEHGSDIGHFTLKGQREPFQQGNSDNMCLFNVVAEQTGQNPNDLKNKTLNIMENNKNTVAKQVKHINRLEMYDKSSLIEGGAQYNGTCPDHAKEFLRNSNGIIGFRNKFPGHADIHIPFEGETIEPGKSCIENETMKNPKQDERTGFISEDEQAFVFHYVMQTDAAKDALNELNEYKPRVNESAFYTKKKVKIPAKELKLPRPAYGGLWKQGKLQETWPVTDIFVQFQHYKGHANNPKARVHIQTFYPFPPRTNPS